MTLVCARRPGLCRVVSVSDNQVFSSSLLLSSLELSDTKVYEP